MVVSTLFRAMAAVVSNVWLAKHQLQLWQEQSNLERDSEPKEIDCPNAVKAKIVGKGQRLVVLSKLLKRAGSLSDSPVTFLQWLFVTKTEYLFSFLTMTMSAPQSLQSALF